MDVWMERGPFLSRMGGDVDVTHGCILADRNLYGIRFMDGCSTWSISQSSQLVSAFKN